MKLTNKHKMYGLVVAVGLGWLVFDQISTPAEAVAEETGDFAAERHAPVAPTNAVAHDRLGDRLQTTAARLKGAAGRDPFEVPMWLSGQSAESRSGAPRPTWKLSAIMRTSDGGIAIIDGQPVRLGQTYQGYRLIQVQTRSATFEKDGERLIMRLAQ